MKLPRISAVGALEERSLGRSSAEAVGGIQPAACNQFQLQLLQSEVAKWCKGEASSCRNVDDCNELIERADTNSRCAAARRDINTACFDGGDEGHREAQRRAGVAQYTCLNKFAAACQQHPEHDIVTDFLRLHPNP